MNSEEDRQSCHCCITFHNVTCPLYTATTHTVYSNNVPVAQHISRHTFVHCLSPTGSAAIISEYSLHRMLSRYSAVVQRRLTVGCDLCCLATTVEEAAVNDLATVFWIVVAVVTASKLAIDELVLIVSNRGCHCAGCGNKEQEKSHFL